MVSVSNNHYARILSNYLRDHNCSNNHNRIYSVPSRCDDHSCRHSYDGSGYHDNRTDYHGSSCYHHDSCYHYHRGCC